MRQAIIIGFVLITILPACKKSTPSSSKEPVILKIADTEVPTSDFEYVYNKNNTNANDAYSDASLREYLGLYTNFKLKVKEAEALGLDTSAAFKSELEGYRRQLAQPYLTEKNVTDSLVREAYDRLKTEVNAAHILITVSPDAEPADTLRAFETITALRKQALGGESFESLAIENSQDPSVKNNKGDLGYFTALQMVYPFEEAAYNTTVGQISQPFRSRFGYHILKVKDTRPSQGRVRVSHIMIRTNPGMSAKDSLASQKRIDEIKSKLESGEPWEKMVLQFSEDQGSKEKEGMLPEFGTNSMLPGFEKAAFGLEKKGDISDPFSTPYGWHIIRLEEKIDLKEFSAMENELKTKVGKDSRSSVNQRFLVDRLKKENNFTESEGNLKYALAVADTNTFKGTMAFDRQSGNMQKELFSVNLQKYTVADFLDYVNARPRENRDISPSHYMTLLYTDYKNNMIVRYEEENLGKKHPEYRMLLREYNDGILLFQLMDEKVWSKAVKDTAGLKEFFNDNRDNYRWSERALVEIVDAKDKATLNKTLEAAKVGKFPKEDAGFVPFNFLPGTAYFTRVDSTKVKVLSGKMQKDTTLIVKIIGEPEANKKASVKLAQKRAQKVMDAFVNSGISSSRLLMELKPANPKAAETPVSFEVYTTSMSALEPQINKENPLDLKVTEGLYQQKELPVLQKVPFQKGTYNVDLNDRTFRVTVQNVQPPRQKTFDEAKGIVISDYQNHLEKEWLEELRVKYPVTIVESEVERLVKQHQ